MTVAQFQKINEINNTTPDSIERLGWIICYLWDMTEEKVNGWNPVKFLWYAGKVERRVNAKPSKFLIPIQTDASKVTLGQFIECQHWLKNDTIPAMDLIAASLMFKRGDHAEDAEWIRGISFRRVYSQVVAFVESMNKLIKSYSGLFEQDDEPEEGERKVKSHPFVERYGWIYSAKQLAEYEGISLNAAYDLPIIQAFNGLAYLKSKQSYEKMKSK